MAYETTPTPVTPSPEAAAPTTPASGATSPSPASPPSGDTTWVNPDGSLKEGWQNHLIPEDFRGRNVYKAVGKDVTSLLRHIGHQDKVIGQQGKGIFPPGPEATQTEKDIFYKALGRPDKPDEYKVEIPQADANAVGEFKSLFHKIGLNQTQVDALVAMDKKRMEAAAKQMEENPTELFEQLLPKVEPIYKERCEAELKKRWGDAFDSRMHLANRAIQEHTREGEDRELLLTRIGNDPVVADFIATIMDQHYTTGTGVDNSSGTPGPTANIDQRIDELMRDPNYVDGRSNPGRHKYLIDEVQKLFAMKRK